MERNVAKLCYCLKQHFATKSRDTRSMEKKPINDVLAANLAHFMQARGLTQKALEGLSGVGQTTISLYLHPDRRAPGKSGKVPSAKLSEVESLANALDIEVWQLLRSLTPSEREAYEQIENAYLSLKRSAQPDSPTKKELTSTKKTA